MAFGIAVLVLAYVLSQFYRAFLAVLTPALGADLGATPEDLSYAVGLWFLVFAAMQIPVGEALDRIGPRLTAVILFALGAGGGAFYFAFAQSPADITVAMVMIGIGCSPVLMASYYIFARVYSPAVFATLAGAVIGVGSLGNIASSIPMAWAAEAFGWRGAMMGLSALTLGVAALMWLTIKDPEKIQNAPKGSVLDLLRIPALWLILPMMFVNYAPAAGIRGLWAGPYASDVFGANAVQIGQITLLMGMAMIAGNFAYGPMDRLLGTRKWVILGGNLIGAGACFALASFIDVSVWLAAALMAAIGFFGASFPLLIGHGRAFFPPHLTGRGVTLMNLFGIAGVGVMQFVTGRLHATTVEASGIGAAPYAQLFNVYGAFLLLGMALYLFSKDRTD